MIVGVQNRDLNSEVIKFGVGWIIRLSLQFFHNLLELNYATLPKENVFYVT
jgi:hypothetical protein